VTSTNFGTVREAIYAWDAIPGLIRHHGASDDGAIAAAIVDAYDKSHTIPYGNLPAITPTDATYVAINGWLAGLPQAGVHTYTIQAAVHFLEQWIEDSRNRP